MMDEHVQTRLSRVALAVFTTIACAAGPAVSFGDTELAEVIVTAERRSQSIQDVPLSIAAIGGDDVRLGKVMGLNDIAFKTPGVSFNQFNMGEPRVYIRGIGNSSDSAASDQAVGMFLDEVYIGRTGGVGFDLIDLERVEILRGPQGTLYGKNTSGGAINVVTAKPSKDAQSKVSVSAGNYNLLQVQALLNGGLTDSVAGKLVLSYKDRDGYSKNVITPGEITTPGDLSKSVIIGPSIGAAPRRLDDGRDTSVRGQLLWEASDKTKLLLGADYSKSKTNGSCRHLLNLSASGGLASLWALGTSSAYQADVRNCSTQFRTDQDRTLTGLLARLDSDLGWSTLTSITAWRRSDYTLADDLTGLPLNNPASAATVPENVIDAANELAKQFSQELRLTGEKDRFSWVTGLYYLRENVERAEEFYTQYSRALQPLGLAAIGDVLFTQDNVTKSVAAYAQADWRFVDKWTLTYGVRWSDDKKNIVQNSIDLRGLGSPTGVPLILPQFAAPVRAEQSWSKVTSKVSMNYKPVDGVMLFATYSQGFKSGAFPSQSNVASVAATAVDPETVNNVEFGIKSEWWNRRLQLNAVYYDMDYKNLQVFELNSRLLLTLTNAQAKSKGFDVNLNVRPIDGLRLALGYNHSNARYTHFITTSGVDVSGNRMVFAPNSAYSADVDYTLPLGSSGSLNFNAGYNHKGEYFTGPSNELKVRQAPLGMVDAGIRWTSNDESLSVSAWGHNLSDELQIASRIVDATKITSEAYMAPRTWGVSVSKTF